MLGDGLDLVDGLNIDLAKVGRPEGQKKVFLPTDDPFGYIEAVISR